MKRAALFLALIVTACSRRDPPPPTATAPAERPSAAVIVPLPPASAAPSLTAVGVCNKLRSAGVVDACAPDDAGTVAQFRKGRVQGMVNVATSRAAYDRVLNTVDFKDMQLATSDEKLVIVYWKSTGSEVDDGLIRSVVMGL